MRLDDALTELARRHRRIAGPAAGATQAPLQAGFDSLAILLMDKLEARNRAEVVAEATRRGWIRL